MLEFFGFICVYAVSQNMDWCQTTQCGHMFPNSLFVCGCLNKARSYAAQYSTSTISIVQPILSAICISVSVELSVDRLGFTSAFAQKGASQLYLLGPTPTPAYPPTLNTMAKKKNKKKSKSGVVPNPTSSQSAANAVETEAAIEIEDTADREDVKDKSSDEMLDRDETTNDTAPITKGYTAANNAGNMDGPNDADAEDTNIMESISFVGDIDMSWAPSASEDVIDAINEASKALQKDQNQTDINDHRGEGAQQDHVIDNDKDTSDVEDKSSREDRAEPIEASNLEVSMTTPLLSDGVSEREGLEAGQSPLNEPVERKQSYEETAALISKIEEGVKRGPPLSSDDPWSSFDSTNGKKSKSVVVIEEHEPNIIWTWITERACCKRKTRGYF
jgi:hypothetical protein